MSEAGERKPLISGEKPTVTTISSDVPELNTQLEWKDIRFAVYNTREGHKKEILCGINGRLDAGNFLGILGGSGAGKTSFLNVCQVI